MGKNVEIPDEHYEKFAERAPDKGFETAEEYVNYVLGQIYEKLQRQEQNGEETTYTKEEEEKVKDRLRGLGYLD